MRSGGTGVGDLALPTESSHHTEHIRRAMSLKSKETLYTAQVPIFDQESDTRTEIAFPFNLPHEAFADAYDRA
eukprot:7045787-Pyramimonas_sp.AAC.1